MDAIYNENILDFSTADSSNWTVTTSTLTDLAGKMRVTPVGLNNKIVRSFSGFDISHENLTIFLKLTVNNAGNLPVHSLNFNIPGLGSYSYDIIDLSPGEIREELINISFDGVIPGTSIDLEISQDYLAGGPNTFIELDEIVIKQVVITQKTRAYFFLGDLFTEALTKKSGRLHVSILNIDGINQLTPEYIADQNSLSGSVPLTEWGYLKCDFESDVCDVTEQYDGYNPFFDELKLDFNIYGQGKRKRAINPINNKDYGLGLLNIGVDKQSIFDANGIQRNGAIFIDIDFTKKFEMRIDTFLSDVVNAYVNSVFTKSFVIVWDPNGCNLKFNEIDLKQAPVVETNILHLGFLKGTLTPGENPVLEGICGTPPADCEYKERTLGYATFVQLPPEQPDDKGFKECCYNSIVLADSASTDDYKNDYSGFYHQKQLDAETIVYKMTGPGGLDVTLNNNTYGEYINGYTDNPNLVTMVIDWKKVLDGNGPGYYMVIKEVTIAGLAQVIDLGGFNLSQYTTAKADKTVRIDSIMNGLLVDQNIDFTNTNFKTSLRAFGFFGDRDPDFTEDILITESYRKDQVSIRQENEYKLQVVDVPECVTTQIFDFMLMGNDLFMNDYNLNNHSYKYKKFPVVYSGNDGTERSNFSRKETLNLSFSKKSANNIKRNY